MTRPESNHVSNILNTQQQIKCDALEFVTFGPVNFFSGDKLHTHNNTIYTLKQIMKPVQNKTKQNITMRP